MRIDLFDICSIMKLISVLKNHLDSVYVDSKVVVFYPDFPQEYGPEQMEGVDPKFGVRILKVVGDVS